MKIRMRKEHPKGIERCNELWWRYDIVHEDSILLSGWIKGNKETTKRKAIAMKKRLEHRGRGLSPVRMVNNGPGVNKRMAEDLR